MARPESIGLTYFSFDTDYKDHPKVKMLIAEFGAKGYIISIELLCYIYNNKGYYMIWDERNKLLFANSVAFCGASVNLCEQVVDFLVKWDFFDENLFNSDKVITNKRCQRMFLDATRKRKNGGINPVFDLISVENGVSAGFPAEETPKKTEETTQNKTKQKKEKEIHKEKDAGVGFFDTSNHPTYLQVEEQFFRLHRGKYSDDHIKKRAKEFHDYYTALDWKKGITKIQNFVPLVPNWNMEEKKNGYNKKDEPHQPLKVFK